jgi:hypothetical protein
MRLSERMPRLTLRNTAMPMLGSSIQEYSGKITTTDYVVVEGSLQLPIEEAVTAPTKPAAIF